MTLTEDQEGWNLNCEHGVVLFIQIDFRVGLFFRDDSDTARLSVEVDCELQTGQNIIKLSPEEPLSLAPILTYRSAPIVAVKISPKGYLIVKFSSGDTLHVNPHERYEAWELGSSVEGGLSMICSPGGMVTLFKNDPQVLNGFHEQARTKNNK